jgi:LmbE family N-acetylglucosaminyl deacetylase
MSNSFPESARVAVLVAHPDDELLWCGGALLMNRGWKALVATLCRGSDADRSQKFARVVEQLGADGVMADLDDGPEQLPLQRTLVRATLRALIAERSFDLVLTHAPHGEYTRHLRHEEVSAAVLEMWSEGELGASQLWLFAYDDDERRHLPRADPNADLTLTLPDEVWREKARLLTDGYGFGHDSWEARVTPRSEAFWRVRSRADALGRLGA